MKHKIEVGQMVYLNGREHEVKKVGRKFFYIGERMEKIDAEALVTTRQYGANNYVYLSFEDWNDSVMREKYIRKILGSSSARLSKLPTEKLKIIYDILTENETTT